MLRVFVAGGDGYSTTALEVEVDDDDSADDDSNDDDVPGAGLP